WQFVCRVYAWLIVNYFGRKNCYGAVGHGYPHFGCRMGNCSPHLVSPKPVPWRSFAFTFSLTRFGIFPAPDCVDSILDFGGVRFHRHLFAKFGQASLAVDTIRGDGGFGDWRCHLIQAEISAYPG